LLQQQQQQEQPKKEKKFQDEDPLDPNEYFKSRVQQLKNFESKGMKMYPHKFEVSLRLPQFVKTYAHLKETPKKKIRKS